MFSDLTVNIPPIFAVTASILQPNFTNIFKMPKLTYNLTWSILLCFFSFSAYTQNPEVVEVSYQEVTTKIRSQAVDENGNTYYAGNFKGALVVQGDTLAYGKGGEDYFLMKKTSLGNTEWAIPFGSEINDASLVHITWIQGNLYLHFGIPVAMTFQNLSITPLYNQPINWVTIKLNDAGTAIWVKRSNFLIREFYDINGGSIAAISESLQGDVIPKIENETIFNLNGQRSVLLTKITGEGNFLSCYSFTNTFNLNSRLDIITKANPGKNQLYFLINQLNIGAQAGNNEFNINGTSIPLQGPNTRTVLVKTDTAFNVSSYKILNPSGAGIFSGASMAGNQFQFSDDSTSLHLFPTIGTYNLDGYNVSIVARVGLAILDTNLITKQFKFFLSNDGVLNCQQILQNNGTFYVVGTLFGKKTNFGGPTLAPLNQTVQFGNNKNISFDVNGVHKSFILKLDENSNYIDHAFIGDHTTQESINLAFDKIKILNNHIYTFQLTDNIFNPWQINLGLLLIKGGSKPLADQSDYIERVAYFGNKTKLLLGLANGLNAFDTDQSEIIKSANRRDFFYAVIDSNQNIIKYNRIYGSMGNSAIGQTRSRNGKISFILNLAVNKNQIGYNFYKLGNDSGSIVTSQQKLFITIDSLGNFSSYDFENTPIGPIIDFDYFDNGDLCVITNNNSIPYNLNGLIFPNNNGFNIGRMNPAFQLSHAIKYWSTSFSQFFPRSISVIKGTDDFHFLTSNNLTANRGEIVSITNSRGNTNVYSTNLINPHPTSPTIKYYHLLGKANFENDKGTSLIGSFTVGSAPALSVIGQRAFVVFSAAPIDQDIFKFNGNDVFTTPNAGRTFILGIDDNNLLKNTFISPASQPQLPTSLFARNLKTIDNHLFLAGSQTTDLKFGALNILHKGEFDGLILKLDTALNMVQYYSVASIYSDLCTDIDIHPDSSVMIAYQSQGNPTPKIGLNQVSLFQTTSGILPTDLEASGYVSQLSAAIAPNDYIFTIKNGSWHDATIWNTGTVPKTTDRVFVRHKVQILQPAECRQVLVDPGSDLKLGEGIELKIAGN